MGRPGRRARGLIAATSTIAVFGITVGLTVPLLTLVLEKQGYSEGLIGLNAATQFLGIMGFSPLAPRAIREFGLFRVMAGSLAVCAACLAVLPLFPHFGVWLVIRLLFGGAEGLLFVAAETWVNQIVEDRLRGRTVALYGTALAAGFAVGPLIITVTGIADATPFVVGVVLVLAGYGPLLLGLGAAPSMPGAPSNGLLAIVRAIPIAVASALLFGLLDGGLIALLAVYGLAIGLDTAGAAQLVTVLVFGGIFLQLPIGWLADQTNRMLVLTGCGFVGALLLATIPLATQPLLFALLFGLGGMLGSYWTLSMAILGARFRDGDLAAGNVGLTLAYGVGSVAGPAIGGYAMELWRPHGLMAVLAAFTLAFAIYGVTLRRGTR